MSIERFILIAITVLSISSMLYIPKKKVNVAFLSFLAFQATSWLASILLVQRGKAVYPVREFTKATNINFIPQFLFYPTIFMWHILLFPKDKCILFKVVHSIIFVSVMVWFVFFVAKYTDILIFPNSSDFSSVLNGYIRIIFQFSVCHFYINWFYKKYKKE